MMNDELMTKHTARTAVPSRLVRHSCLVIPSSFIIRHSSLFLLLFFTRLSPGADNLGVLGTKPKWPVLEHYQETITHDQFTHLFNDVYCTHGFAADLFKIDTDSVRILTSREKQTFFTLRFANDVESSKKVPRLWRGAKDLGQASAGKPLIGLRVALDPGHLGGKWARMEERWFQVAQSEPVREGDLALRVARLIAPRLRELGA